MQSGFTDAALGLIVVPEKDATEESQVYGELRGLLAAKCLGFLVGAPNVASALGRDYLSRQLAVISGTEDWKRPETLATHARLLLQNSARLPSEWRDLDTEPLELEPHLALARLVERRETVLGALQVELLEPRRRWCWKSRSFRKSSR